MRLYGDRFVVTASKTRTGGNFRKVFLDTIIITRDAPGYSLFEERNRLSSMLVSESEHSLIGQAGGDRQELHEKIRVHSMDAGMTVKAQGKANDLLARLAADPAFAPVHGKLDSLLDPSLFIGRSPEQVSVWMCRCEFQRVASTNTFDPRQSRMHACKSTTTQE